MNRLANLALFGVFLLADPAFSASDEPQKPPVEPQITVQGARTEAETKARLRADQAMARCQYKPVMTDEEIAQCVAAQRASVEAARPGKKGSGTFSL
jgi:hypothetical protein